VKVILAFRILLNPVSKFKTLFVCKFAATWKVDESKWSFLMYM